MRIIASIILKPILCRLFSLSGPGFPNPTSKSILFISSLQVFFLQVSSLQVSYRLLLLYLFHLFSLDLLFAGRFSSCFTTFSRNLTFATFSRFSSAGFSGSLIIVGATVAITKSLSVITGKTFSGNLQKIS